MSGSHVLTNDIDASPTNPDYVDGWDDEKNYDEGDWVKYDGMTYYCLSDNTGEEPGSCEGSDYWREMWEREEGWEPIGSKLSSFSGTFDGNDHTISGLFIYRPGEDNVGLFGGLSGGVVKNLGLEDVNVTAESSIGALVGYFNSPESAVENSYAAGNVTGTGFSVGGLVGSAYNGTVIENSYFTGTVTGGQQRTGGLLGSGGRAVLNSYAAGAVFGDSYVGGLVGISNADIIDSYATGAVTGTGTQVGGLLGVSGSGAITNSYSTGAVDGVSFVGGFVGDIYIDDDVTIEDSFWDVDEDGLATGSGEDNFGATGKTTEEMKDISTFNAAGWDIRTSGRDFNDGYPYLPWELNGRSRVWLIYEEPAPEPAPEPEHEHPAPPAGFNARYEDGFLPSIHLWWVESEEAVKYRLYVSTGSDAQTEEAAAAEISALRFYLLAELLDDVLEYTHTGLSAIRYYYVITSVYEEGLESDVTSPVYWANPGTGEYGYMEPIPWPGKIIDEPDDDDSSSCFIAAAAYGSGVSTEAMSLRTFRDGFLLKSGAGNRLVETYYAASPAFAGIIAESGILRKAARLHLAPLAKFAGLIANMN